MNNNKSSIIWQLDRVAFQKLVNECLTREDILKKLGLQKGSYKTLRKRIIGENINIDHILLNDKNRTAAAQERKKIPLSKILVSSSIYTSIASLKKRLVSEGLLNPECYECSLKNIWNGKLLSLQLDHINGINNDHRLENLRLLCPNCHSQTSNYAGRNCRHSKNKKKNCLDCNKEIRNKSIRCKLCAARDRSKLDQYTKIIWPSDEKLLEMLELSNFSQVGKILGVSDNAIRKRLRKKFLL